jgi:hypothetical protein
MARPRSNRKRLHVMVTENQHQKLRALAEESGYSFSELMRRAIDLYLSKVTTRDD